MEPDPWPRRPPERSRQPAARTSEATSSSVLPPAERGHVVPGKTPRSERGWRIASVVRGRRREHDPLELLDRAAAEPQRGHEALLPELARVERGAERVDGGPVLLGHLVLGDLDEHEVAGAAVGVRHPDLLLALGGIEAVERDHDRLAGAQPLGSG